MRVQADAEQPHEISRIDPTVVLAAACDVAAVALLLFLIVGRIFFMDFKTSHALDWNRMAVVALAASFLVLRLLSHRLAARVTLAIFSLLASTSFATLLCPLLAIDVAFAMKSAVATMRDGVVGAFGPASLDAPLFILDERYGWILHPNARSTERTGEFTATYTIDATGHRVTPPPREHPKATVVFVGDSFTFGVGVNDSEPYSSVLAAQYWRDVSVVNAGVDGWGLTQMYQTVVDTLARKPLPTMIVVAMISDDLYRSYLRGPVEPAVKRQLEFVDGALILRDVTEGQAPAAVDEELKAKELAINRWMLGAMNRACEEKHVELAVLLFADAEKYSPDWIYDLGAQHIPTVDLTRVEYERFQHDGHPNAAGHRRLAEAVSKSIIADMLYGPSPQASGTQR